MKRFVSLERVQVSESARMFVVQAPPDCPVQDATEGMMPLSVGEAGLSPGQEIEIDGQRSIVIQVGRGRAPGTMIVMARTA